MTKKYFGTDGVRGAVNSKYINGDMFFKFGLASGIYFKSQKKRKQVAINQCKWEAANAYCKQQKIRFRVISEDQLFHSGSRK